ncbi:c-type cytochrome [Burkholderia ubonensis]|uniref:c-type cytochrome n=1 Tax=Burkholderia ubonensis TaxID=101571 RepID=UPI0007529740|nr:c-type cytochrome [Burkholderia ubonensis]AOI72963.1 cytochrome C [Burkholderia ubonensis]KUZ10562.1 cytochrome C [Burkholderia ubonensis]KUZ27127.1 cytochrome C [Burkholderia ubonensis]KUZ34642.1 cytochrome C [Burkholderia ubonensis]KUZ43355.1 cytochrome C [Burkholderia ubonensis]
MNSEPTTHAHGAPDGVDVDAASLAGDASRYRHVQYRWPTDDPDARAALDVETRTAYDGRMTTWRYRAQLDRPSGELDASVAANREDVPATFVYRHTHASVEIEDAGRAIPPHAHVFARESFIDELAGDTGRDPVALRLQHLDPRDDAGPREVIRMVAERAAWGAPAGSANERPSSWLRGRGFAFDGVVATVGGAGIERAGAGNDDAHAPAATDDGGPAGKSATDDGQASWTAWVVDVDVDRSTGDVAVRRVVAGQGSGQADSATLTGLPASLIEATISRVMGARLAARPAHDEADGHARAAVSHELVAMRDLAADARPLALSARDAQRIDEAAAPAAAAIANALYDATGVRFRAPPFDAESIRAALTRAVPVDAHERASSKSAIHSAMPRWRRWLGGGGVAGGLIGLACALLPGPAPIAPVAAGGVGGADGAMWSAGTLERGRQIALAGDCAVCHTAPGGPVNAGGLALDTPFGTIYTTNITPDPETGIGAWTYSAFARAMREGIARDGTHLYPAFPYTAFARMSEADLLALYAYLMSQPAVKHTPPKTKLPFPLDQRRLVAGWNWLFHDARPFAPAPDRSAMWNRGKYLVDGAGHCGACHTPRNALGAEQGGLAYLSGGVAEGWAAPSLVASKASPVPWTEDALYDYLRTGFSAQHGVAAGPMAPVVAGLAALPESDVRAIAHYVASLSPHVDATTAAAAAARQARGAEAAATLGFENGRRAFGAACAVCHAESGGVGHFGVRPLMGLNTSVSQDAPDNLLRVLHDGIDHPAPAGLGYMPGFGDAFDDRQMAELAAYIRARYAPGQPAWRDLEAASARIRREHS